MRALLKLCRIPNVFTAVANVVAGVALVRGGRFELGDAWLLGSTAALYSSGMVLNDFFDRRVDARERPDRPIPAGEVTPLAAASLGAALMLIGVCCAAVVGVGSLAVSGALALAILAYDAGLKSTPLGPWSMGACRALNVGLGMSVAEWSGMLAVAPTAMGLFTVAITYLSRDEVTGATAHRTRWIVVALGVLAAAVLVALVPLGTLASLPRRAAYAAPFAGFLLVRGFVIFAPLWRSASGPDIGRAIGGGILLMPALDATVLAGAGHPAAALAVLLVGAPAYALRRWYYLT